MGVQPSRERTVRGESPRAWLRSRRGRLTVAAVAAVVLLGTVVVITRTGAGSPSTAAPTASNGPSGSPAGPNPGSGLGPALAVPVPSTGAYFGTHFSKDLPDRQATLLDLEGKMGRKFAIDHVYYRWDTTFPAEYDRWTAGQGRLLFLSWTTLRSQGPAVKWADIASGRQDQVIDARAAAIKTFGHPLLLGFAHEPGALVGSTNFSSGTPTEYVAAWKHLKQRFQDAGVHNVSWVWTLTGQTFRHGDPESFYPGDAVVDWVGVDGYANLPCPGLNAPWAPWSQVFGGAVQFAQGRAKPLIVAEFGVGEDAMDSERKARWYRDAATTIAKTPTIKAVVSFNSQASCSAYAAGTPASLAGYRDMGQSGGLLVQPGAAATQSPGGG